MHHASAAGSRSPTPVKSAAVTQTTSQSSADAKQALAEVDLNQRTASWQPSRDRLQSSDMPWQELQAIKPQQPQPQPQQQQRAKQQQEQGQLAKQQQHQLEGGHMHQQPSQEGAELMHGAGSRQAKQLRWADTHTQPDAQLLHNSPQAATVRHSVNLPDETQALSLDTDHQQHQTWDVHQEVAKHGKGHAAGSHQTHSIHVEELQVLAQMLEPTAVVQTDQPHKVSHPQTTQHSTPGPDWDPSQHYEAFQYVASVQARCPSTDEGPSYGQHALQTAKQMQLPNKSRFEQSFVNNNGAAYQQLLELPPARYDGAHLGVRKKAHLEADPHFTDTRELPAGIPLTPVLVQRAEPRDSLEASIWKLSGGSNNKQMTTAGRVLSDVVSPICYASVKHDSLLESPHALAETQQRAGRTVLQKQ